MSRPSSRTELKDYIMRNLGHPVVQINVDEDQVEDRISDALQFFAEYSDDGRERTILKHQITSADRANALADGYIELDVPSNVDAVINVFPIAHSSSTGLFSLKYQQAMDDVNNWGHMDMIGYSISRSYFNLIDEQISPGTNYEFRRVKDSLKIYLTEDNLPEGKYILFEVWQVLDPDTYTEIYNDILLKRYATALVKRQWGANLSKFEGMQMPGGITFNGQQIFDQATTEIQELEESIQSKYSEPPMGFFF